MKLEHVYGLFESRASALAAYEALLAKGYDAEHCSVLIHRDHLDEEELSMSETAAREGAKKGALIAGATGALIAGLAVVSGGILGLGPLAAMLGGGGVGAAYGTVFGAISGASEPDARLRKIESDLQAGRVLITVDVDDATLAASIRADFQARGAATTLPV